MADRGNESNSRKHAADISDGLVLARRVISEVGVRGPVCGLVLSDGTRGAVGSSQSVVIRNVAEA